MIAGVENTLHKVMDARFRLCQTGLSSGLLCIMDREGKTSKRALWWHDTRQNNEALFQEKWAYMMRKNVT